MVVQPDYEGLKVLKQFVNKGKSLGVFLLEGNIVRKSYDPCNPQHVAHFWREITILKHANSLNYKYVPKLLKVDKKKFTLWETYCGARPPKTPENRALIYKRAIDLHKKCGVVRREPEDGRIVRKIYMGNTGLMNGKIYIFDFGGAKWHIEPIIKNLK